MWVETVLCQFVSFFKKSHKNLLSGSLHKVSIKLEIKSGNRTFISITVTITVTFLYSDTGTSLIIPFCT